VSRCRSTIGPAGYPLLVALALPFTGWSSAGGQAVSIVAGAGAAGLTYLLSRELLPDAPSGRIAAWVAGLAVALSGAVLRANLVVMSDALAMGCCAAAIWSLACYTRTRRWPWLAGAAVALAWAIITRWVLRAAGNTNAGICTARRMDEGRRTKDEGQQRDLYSSSVFRLFVSRRSSVTERGRSHSAR